MALYACPPADVPTLGHVAPAAFRTDAVTSSGRSKPPFTASAAPLGATSGGTLQLCVSIVGTRW